MNYLTDKEIHRICEEYGINNYTINSDGSIDVDGSVDLRNRGLTKLPLKFNHVSGHFYCSENELTTLEFSPKSVGSNFNCIWNNLESLEFSPKSVNNFYCSWNKLTTLDFAPQSVGGSFYCGFNPIYDQLGDIDYKSYIKQLNRDKILNELLYSK
mgnify:CR=1 FL=1|jgi:hypothetical protein